MSFITFWCKPLKTDPFREIYTYTTSLKPSFAKLTPLYMSAAAQLANV